MIYMSHILFHRCGDAVPDLNPTLEAEKGRYREMIATKPAKLSRIVQVKKAQKRIQRQRVEQGLDGDEDSTKPKRSSQLRDKLKGRQKGEGAQLEVELEKLQKDIDSLDSGSFLAEVQQKEDAWKLLRQVSCVCVCERGWGGVYGCGCGCVCGFVYVYVCVCVCMRECVLVKIQVVNASCGGPILPQLFCESAQP